jgi:hypothetical protein
MLFYINLRKIFKNMPKFLPYYILFTGGWSLINGILHDIAVIRKYPVFDKQLITLLIDGHILIFSGIFFLFTFSGIETQESWAFYIGIIDAIFMLGYCALILKILPAITTILINIIALILLILYFPKSQL